MTKITRNFFYLVTCIIRYAVDNGFIVGAGLYIECTVIGKMSDRRTVCIYCTTYGNIAVTCGVVSGHTINISQRQLELERFGVG